MFDHHYILTDCDLELDLTLLRDTTGISIKMKLNTFSIAFGLLTPANAGLLRFGCAQLTVQRLDPLVNPGANPSPHIHQIIGGVSFTPNPLRSEWTVDQRQNSFNITMDPQKGHDLAKLSTCTTCEMAEDFSMLQV